MTSQTALHLLRQHGQAAWLDFLSRDLLRSGELAGLIGEGVSGVTSNPTIFAQALSQGDAYDEQIASLIASVSPPTVEDVFTRLATDDVRAACDLFADSFARGEDGWVSIEVDPRLAHDTEATIEQALELHALVNRPNCFVKVPATEAGLPAIEALIHQGISVNVTLIFSLERHAEVIDAYMSGLEKRLGDGESLAGVSSVASFFVSRVDTEADRRLEAVGRDDLKGRLAVANAKLAYAQYQRLFGPAGGRWQALQAEGASPQRCLWASTGVKDPAYPDTLYVDTLIGPETVSTMPLSLIRAVQDHAVIADTVTVDPDGARAVFDEISAIVDYRDVVTVLEVEGVDKFEQSFAELTSNLQQKIDTLRGGGAGSAA